MKLLRIAVAEGTGTAALLCAVVGSGIMAERLAGGNAAIALLANTLVTVSALFVLIETLGPVSGAHFNPLITWFIGVASPSACTQSRRNAVIVMAAQLVGAVAGTWLAHLMFGLNVLQLSHQLRDGPAQWLAELVATAGLIVVILRSPQSKVAGVVACYIGAAYWFTSSTSFANPAAVLGRMLSDTFAGIAPDSAPGFVLAQVAGAFVGVILHRLLGNSKA